MKEPGVAEIMANTEELPLDLLIKEVLETSFPKPFYGDNPLCLVDLL